MTTVVICCRRVDLPEQVLTAKDCVGDNAAAPEVALGTRTMKHKLAIGLFSLAVVCVGWRIASVFPPILDDRACREATERQLDAVEMAVRCYYEDMGAFPSCLDDLLVSSVAPGPPRFAHLIADLPIRDAWGRDVRYRVDAVTPSFQIRSLGRDGLPGGAGLDADIVRPRSPAGEP